MVTKAGCLRLPKSLPFFCSTEPELLLETSRPSRRLLRSERLDYSTVNSPQLNGMSESQIREYRLLIVPGGNFEHIGNSLTSEHHREYSHRDTEWLELSRNLRGRFLCRQLPLQRFESDVRVAVRVLRCRSSGHPQGSGSDYRCRRTNARSVLGGWPAAYRLGCGRRQVSRRNPRHRGGRHSEADG